MKGPAPTLLVAVLALASCAYYNGLYNAKDLAHRAEHAERQGREFEAKGLWAQSAVKAETVLVHHPHSRWTEEARWLTGKALERSGDCRGAIGPLARTVQEAADPKRVDDAALRLATCEAALGDLDAAGRAAARLVDHSDPRIRSEAQWRAGVTYRHDGRTVEAIALLRRSGHPRARGELAAALADHGELGAALALADSLLAEHDTLAPWGAILQAVARRDPASASTLLDRAVAGLSPPIDSTQTWLVADAQRWLPDDTTRAFARLRQAHAAGPERAAGLGALLTLLNARLSVAGDPAILDTIGVLLSDIPPTAGAATFSAQVLGRRAAAARRELAAIVPGVPQGDLRGFLLAEKLRDTLHAPRLAATLWRQLVLDHPGSPYAPKALLALAAAGGGPGDSVLAILEARYPASPYLHAYRGEADPGFQSLEDSLLKFGRALAAADRPGRGPRLPRDSAAATGRVLQ